MSVLTITCSTCNTSLLTSSTPLAIKRTHFHTASNPGEHTFRACSFFCVGMLAAWCSAVDALLSSPRTSPCRASTSLTPAYLQRAVEAGSKVQLWGQAEGNTGCSVLNLFHTFLPRKEWRAAGRRSCPHAQAQMDFALSV